MTRQRLPDRRPSLTFDVVIGSQVYSATVSRFSDGRLAEIFLAGKKIGSDLDCAARDSAVVASLGLQYGVPLDVIRGALLRDGEGRASGPLCAALDKIEEMA